MKSLIALFFFSFMLLIGHNVNVNHIHWLPLHTDADDNADTGTKKMDFSESLTLDFSNRPSRAPPTKKESMKFASRNVGKYTVGQALRGLGQEQDIAGVVRSITPDDESNAQGPGTIELDINNDVGTDCAEVDHADISAGLAFFKDAVEAERQKMYTDAQQLFVRAGDLLRDSNEMIAEDDSIARCLLVKGVKAQVRAEELGEFLQEEEQEAEEKKEAEEVQRKAEEQAENASVRQIATGNIGKYNLGQPITHPQASGFIVVITANTPGATSGPGVLGVSPSRPVPSRPGGRSQQSRQVGFTTTDSSGAGSREQEQERSPPPISAQQFAMPVDCAHDSDSPEQSFLTYTCCTHPPKEYGEGTGYSLKVNELNRQISLAICVTMYNESASEARSTLQQVGSYVLPAG
jgi:hypothetical protein